MIRRWLFPTAFVLATVAQVWLGCVPTKDFVSVLLTVFSIIFGFYSTCFAVFATSKYMARLYQVEDSTDNRKTLLDTLLNEFTSATYFLLGSIIFLLIAHIITENTYRYANDALYLVWGVVTFNLLYACDTIATFVKVTRQSAKISEDIH